MSDTLPLPRVLLIDDEPFQLRILGRQLANLGFTEQDSCTDGREAMTWIEREPARFGLVTCDLHMPAMDGIEVVRRLGELQYAGALLLVSGEDQRILAAAEGLAQARALNVLGAVCKPVPPDKLKRALAPCRAAPAQPPTAAAAAGSRVGDDIDAAALKLALAHGELLPHFQPKVELATGRVVGVEALARWPRPGRAQVGPDRFVDLAESSGLIGALTDAMLSQSLAEAARWDAMGLGLQVSVNVSMLSLVGPQFPDHVALALQGAGLAASRLILEVTESRLMEQRVATLDNLVRLRLKRIGLSIDDFGTGHSSLAQLRDVPFDEIKLDRQFVHGVHANASQQAIVGATLEMARKLGIKTVAEGVEQRSDWCFLRDNGCHLAQGWLIGRPMAADMLLTWLADWETRRSTLLV